MTHRCFCSGSWMRCASTLTSEPSSWYLAEDDVTGVQRVADGEEVAALARDAEHRSVSDDRVFTEAGRGQLRDERIGHVLRVEVVLGQAGLVIEGRDGDRWLIRRDTAGVDYPRGDDDGHERQRRHEWNERTTPAPRVDAAGGRGRPPPAR